MLGVSRAATLGALDRLRSCLWNAPQLTWNAMRHNAVVCQVVAFIMRELQVSTEEALAVVGRRRRVFPNNSFLEQLRWFHEHQWSVDKQTADYRALKARYSTPAQIIECPP